MKVYSFPFAVTLESALTAAEFALLQKYDPRALALREVNPDGSEYETFRIGHCPVTEYGSVKASGITFAGETGKEYGMAGRPGVTILIPATLKGDAVKAYIRDKIALIETNVNAVEKNAKAAIKAVEDNNKRLEDSIILLSPKAAKEAKPEIETPKKEAPKK